MDIHSVDSSQMARTGEVDRAELIEVKYRCALASDGHSIAVLEEKMDPPEQVPDWDHEGVRRRAKWWKREVDEGGALFSAEDGGKLAGFVVLGAEKAGKCAEMVALFVDKGHRGKGLGRRLVQRLEDEARQRGIKNI